MSEALTAVENKQLSDYEGTIERHIEAFWEVGNALMAIRDGKLYREDYRTFDEYCRERWGMERTYAHRMIEASKVATNLLPMDNTPKTERVVRPLTSLPPDKQREAYQKAVDTAPNGKVTAKHVQATVEGMNPPPHIEKHPVTDALVFSGIAISQLERIRRDDPKRAEALEEVALWIEVHK
jgi:hypothetical protein